MGLVMLQALAIFVFLIGLYLIIREEHYGMEKAEIAVTIGCTLTIIAVIFNAGNAEFQEVTLAKSLGHLLQVLLFVFASNYLAEILNHYGLMSYVSKYLYKYRKNNKKQFWLLQTIVFWVSSVAENVSTTVGGVILNDQVFKEKNRTRSAVMVPISANAGGAFSPIGDTTTTMLWLAGVYKWYQVVFWALLPSLIMWLVTNWFMGRGIEQVDDDDQPDKKVFTKSELAVCGVAGFCFLLPLLVKQLFDIEGWVGILLGFGIVAILIRVFHISTKYESHKGAEMHRTVEKIQKPTLIYILGIILAVNAIDAMGIIDMAMHWIYWGMDAHHLVIGHTIIGWVSGGVDNIPLTQAEILKFKGIIHSPAFWSLLAYTVGVGGCLLVIGSSAGLVAMGHKSHDTKEAVITSAIWWRMATMPVIIGYLAGVVAWCLQYYFVKEVLLKRIPFLQCMF